MLDRPRRSALYMPATNARALEKARSLPADAVIIDLEDSIAPSSKAEARTAAAAAVTAGGFGRREVVIRVNGCDSAWFEEDFAAAVAAKPDAVMVPKVESAGDLAMIGERLAALGAAEGVCVWVMIETPLAVVNARAIAAAAVDAPASRLDCLVLGTNDIQKETGALDHPERLPLMYALQASVMAARAYGLAILDGVYNNFRDMEGFRRECEQGRLLGMDGKTLIHPDQIATANATFAPSDSDVAMARKVLAAFAAPENAGKGVVSVDGRMVELLHAEMAKRVVAIAEAIAAAEGAG
jgi:citrate lyase subunit beta/citryl-CoA lyase